MDYIDLHVHSNASDGTLTPTEVVDLATKSGLCAIALTDHDTVNGVGEALLRANQLKQLGTEIEVIPGVELSASYGKKDIHILGLYVDITNPTFIKALEGANNERANRNEKMCANLRAAGIDISMDELCKENKDTVITRAHFAKVLVEKKYAKDNKDAFSKFLDANGPYYVNRNYLTPEEAVDLIIEANGIPVLAHPLLYQLSFRELDSLLIRLKKRGLKAIETIYSSNMGSDESDVRRLARIHGLLMTGGSDFHGANKPLIKIGTGRGNLKISKELLDGLKQLLPPSK